MNHFVKGEFAPAPVRWLLARLEAHTKLGPDDRRSILRLSGQRADVKAGSVIAHPNTEIFHSHLVARGVLAQFEQTGDGRRKLTRLFTPGELGGLQCIESPTVSWGLCAFTACTVIHVPHDDLRKLVDRFPKVRQAFWREMAIDASVQSKWTGNAALKGGPERAAHLICELSLQMERIGLSNRSAFTLDVSQTQLSHALGLTAIHTNRVLRELREKDLVSTTHRAISVRDWVGLSKLAEYDATYLRLQSDR